MLEFLFINYKRSLVCLKFQWFLNFFRRDPFTGPVNTSRPNHSKYRFSVQHCMILTLRHTSLRRVARASPPCTSVLTASWKWHSLTMILSNKVALFLLLTQLKKSDVLCKVTEKISFKWLINLLQHRTTPGLNLLSVMAESTSGRSMATK